MNLSNELIAQFVEATKDENKVKKENTVYGTVVEIENEKYVRIDGSELLTPVSYTTNVDDGERVTVMIKNHTATVTGNISDPSAKDSEVTQLGSQISEFEIVIADKVSTIELEAERARIDDLETENLFVKDTLTANEALIKELETQKLDVTQADIKYANIEFSNITEASIENLFTKSGMINDLVMSSGHVTGELVGVTIKGDLIEAETIVANKLVVLGTDGLYYKLNTSGSSVEAEQTNYNSINGSIITAKSVTANKIYVTDLSAFGATIGGFKITDDSIYSGVKNSIDNSTRGIYLDDDGQIAFGDSNNFIKFYKDQNGEYKLEISALKPSELTSAISSAIDNEEGTISTTEFVMDGTGLTVKNGSIKIENNSGDVVLSGDEDGNLNLCGSIDIRSDKDEYILVSSSDEKLPIFSATKRGTFARYLILTNDYIDWNNDDAVHGSFISLTQDGSTASIGVQSAYGTASVLTYQALYTETVYTKEINMCDYNTGTDGNEHYIVWRECGSDAHKCYLYNGKSTSATRIGLYDKTAEKVVWSYGTDDNFRLHKPTLSYYVDGTILSTTNSSQWKCVQFTRNNCKAEYGIGSDGSGASQNYPAINCINSGETDSFTTRLEIKSNVLKWRDPTGLAFNCWIDDSSGHGGIAIGTSSTTYLKWLRSATQLQVRNYADNAYTQIVASSFTNGSRLEFKENIADISENKIRNIVMDNEIKAYNLISEREEMDALEREAEDRGFILDDEMLKVNTKAGLIIEDLTEDAESLLHPERTDGIDIYVMASILWKHNQSQQKQIETLISKVQTLESLINN